MAALKNTDSIRELSAVSVSEIAIKQAVGKLVLGKHDVLAGIDDLTLRVLPYTSSHALKLFELPLHHTDAFDRQLIAQAMAEDIPIVTSDDKFTLYQGLTIIW